MAIGIIPISAHAIPEELATGYTATSGRSLLTLDSAGNDLYVSVDDREINLYQATEDGIRVIDTISRYSYGASQTIPISPDKFLINTADTTSSKTYLYKADTTAGLTQLSSYTHGRGTNSPSIALIDNTRVLVATYDASRDLRLYVLSYANDTLTRLSDSEMSSSNYSAELTGIQGNQFLLTYSSNPMIVRTVSVNNANTIQILDTHNENGVHANQSLQKTNTDGKAMIYYHTANNTNQNATLSSKFITVAVSGDISVSSGMTQLSSLRFATGFTVDLKITNVISGLVSSHQGTKFVELSPPDYNITEEESTTILTGPNRNTKLAIQEQFFLTAYLQSGQINLKLYGGPDRNPPTLNIPNDISKKTDDPAGITLNIGRATAEDKEDPNPVITNNAPAKFPVGTTCLLYTSPSPRDS